MTPIPKKLREDLANDPYYQYCARKNLFGHTCSGRITWEHALIHKGRRLNTRFAIIPICECAHSVDNFQDGGEMNKEVHVWIALNRASEDELRGISEAVDYLALRERLNAKYGDYQEPYFPPYPSLVAL